MTVYCSCIAECPLNCGENYFNVKADFVVDVRPCVLDKVALFKRAKSKDLAPLLFTGDSHRARTPI